MDLQLPSPFKLSEEVALALALKRPIVALESTVITHGLPYPENLTLARDMEADIRGFNVTPATIALVGGEVHVGVNDRDLEQLAQQEDVHKISTRDLAAAIAKGWSGGTTVAGTMLAAHKSGIQVFATGGIGGVHRGAPFDVSNDLHQLSRTPLIVVCAGAKAILDLHATLEYLETVGVPVVGYQTGDFPAFYSPTSGLKVSVRADSPEDIAAIVRSHWELGLTSAIVVANPPPIEEALMPDDIDSAIQQALEEAERLDIRGQDITPFLLRRVSELTGGASMQANLALLRNNARLAAQVARHLVQGARQVQF